MKYSINVYVINSNGISIKLFKYQCKQKKIPYTKSNRSDNHTHTTNIEEYIHKICKESNAQIISYNGELRELENAVKYI